MCISIYCHDHYVLKLLYTHLNKNFVGIDITKICFVLVVVIIKIYIYIISILCELIEACASFSLILLIVACAKG